MKKLAALALLGAASGAVSAQSSVTLFGVVDAGLRYVKNSDQNLKTLSSNGLNSSRLGLRGVEDLGGGLKGAFWLENGFTPDTGGFSDANRFFNRRSTVSLLGSFGEVRLGRDFTPTYQGYTDYDVFGDNGVAQSSKFDSSLGSKRDTGTRADNQVIYLTPSTLGGFYGRVAVAAGEGVSGKKYAGGRAGFAAGPVDLSVNYGQTTVDPVRGEDKFKVYGGGASYDFVVLKLFAYYEQSKLAAHKLAAYSVGATVPLGQGVLRAQLTRANASGTNAANVDVDADDANQVALGYIWNVSKRTALYGTYARVENKGKAAFVVASAPKLTAGDPSSGFEFGLRHSF